MGIEENVKNILEQIPANVVLVAAVKGRTYEEIQQAISAGIKCIGENYVQEAEKIYPLIGSKVEWHFIGHLQKNKIKKAVAIFDIIETLDSVDTAEMIDYYSKQLGKIMPVFIEVNSGYEPQKAGVLPERIVDLIEEVSSMPNIKVCGLMTMGPAVQNPEDIRPYYKATYNLFSEIQRMNLPRVEMKYLSMGMSDTYKVALEEGANIIRIGTRIFGLRGSNI